MSESGGEAFVIAVAVAIFIAVIIYVFGHFLFLGGTFADSSICYLSSQATNFFYNGLCLSQYLCFSSTLEGMGISPPLLGCSTTSTSYSSSSTQTRYSAVFQHRFHSACTNTGLTRDLMCCRTTLRYAA
jgi:hypothetical protein